MVLTLLFSGVMIGLRAQPYEDGGLRQTLFPADCASPCFMGIRPGVTTHAEALDLLQANPWVTERRADLQRSGIGMGVEWQTARFSAQQPST